MTYKATVRTIGHSMMFRAVNRDRRGPDRNLYPETPWSASFETISRRVAEAREGPEFSVDLRDLFVIAEPIFDTLAAALTFKLEHEGAEFEIEIIEVPDQANGSPSEIGGSGSSSNSSSSLPPE